jgi:O-antigen ligase
MAQRSGVAKIGLAFVGGTILVGAVLVVEFALIDLLGRFDDGVLGDYRFQIVRVALDAAKAFQPIGSGFGTFVPVYQTFERADALIPAYVNHAHDDWLEIWLEGGFLAVAALLGFLVWFVNRAVVAWRRGGEGGKAVDYALPRAASIVLALLMLHSFVDYPLRTTTLMTLFAFCCALLIPPPPLPVKRPAGDQKTPRVRTGGRLPLIAFLRGRRTNRWNTDRVG